MNDSTQLFLWIFLSLDLAVLLWLLVSAVRRRIRRRKILHFGDKAEEEVSETLRRDFPNAAVLNNVYLKTNRGTTQLDHILICKWGVFVIETKSHNGRIQIEKNEWTQFYKDKVVRFHSPILQNESHVRALENVLKKHRTAWKTKVNGLVVFTSKKVFFSKREDGVLRLDELSPYIKSGGKTTSRRTILTGIPGRRYLTRQKIVLLERHIRKHSVKGQKSRKAHNRKLKSLDRSYH
ncbi:MAG: NERD domain-containing protein [Ruminococcaceae bacterium]|nr:NERD domain-containing protein [Oscillospiraceae bacterium]